MADPELWNPRVEPANRHFLLLADGLLHPITATGQFTVKRLRLNRPALIDSRLRKLNRPEATRLLIEARELLTSLHKMQGQHEALLKQYDSMLEAYRLLIERMIREVK